MKCSFCGETLLKGFGKMIVKNDGRLLYFCSSKCQKNMIKLGRDGKTVRWTSTYAKLKKSGQ